jgi:hypothetical protein
MFLNFVHNCIYIFCDTENKFSKMCVFLIKAEIVNMTIAFFLELLIIGNNLRYLPSNKFMNGLPWEDTWA